MLLLTGCIVPGPGSGSDDTTDPTNHDVEQWNQLVAQYDQRRSDFLGKDVQELAPVDNQLFGTSSWVNYATGRDKQTPKGWNVAVR